MWNQFKITHDINPQSYTCYIFVFYSIGYDVVVLSKYLWLNKKDSNWEVLCCESTSVEDNYLLLCILYSHYLFPWAFWNVLFPDDYISFKSYFMYKFICEC